MVGCTGPGFRLHPKYKASIVVKLSVMQDFEKLGAFYLGRPYDLQQRSPKEGLILYDSKDLLTHAVCVGMTGSGKTGLCISLLEEAAIDGIPAIVIDPKGDLSNLLLSFPQLRPEDFAPWINEDEARRQGISAHEFAERQARLWRDGLSQWGQDGSRIERMHQAVDFTVYTPGSDAGIPVSALRSFAAPPADVRGDREQMRERISGNVTALLALLGIGSDTMQSREHILLSSLLDSAWKEGQDLDLGGLIQQIQAPPLQRIGVLDVETFYPAKDRFALAMALNNLLASPGFEAWLQGEPLDVNRILYTQSGKPRISIFSLAHLSDAERMFFVTLLLQQTLGWIRGQSGTTSLRALLYMDEIFGYFPPVANPPSKQPLLTLLKQARAFGLGVVLATQNPVDLDYKGLSNAGTWFIGRLQTARDKARVLDGLEGAAATAGGGFDRDRMEQILAGLGNRIFLMNNVHEDAPEVFEVRWALSYLRGPLTRPQIQRLMSGRRQVVRPAEVLASPEAPRPALPPEVTQHFIPVRTNQPGNSVLFYQPVVAGAAQIHYVDAKTRTDETREAVFVTPLTAATVPVRWEEAIELRCDPSEFETDPVDGAHFAELPSAAVRPKNYAAWQKDLVTWIYVNRKLELFRSPALGLTSESDETERDFRIRLQQKAREERDQAVEKLRQKYAPKLNVLQERVRRALQTLAKEEEQARSAKMETGFSLLGAILGRKAGTAMRSIGRATKESSDVGRAEENLRAAREQLDNLESESHEETEKLGALMYQSDGDLEIVQIRPKKAHISLRLFTLAWAPYWKDDQGRVVPAWE
jgi:hypothetical protein